jgi:hypothetical protein
MARRRPVPPTGGAEHIGAWAQEGIFPQACELCGGHPTVVRVVRVDTDPDPEALHKPGVAEAVQFYWYCTKHRDAAGTLYDDFWRQR